MNIKIKKGAARGKAEIPSSKSVAHRLLINAALTDGKTEIVGLSMNEDIAATIDCLRTLGAKIEHELLQCLSPVRKDRSFPRTQKHSSLKFPFNIKWH